MPAATSGSRTRHRSFKVGDFGWIWIATVALFLVSLVIAPGTMRPTSLMAMLPFASLLAIVAIGQTVVIQLRGLDMSVVALVALGGVMAARFGADLGMDGLGVAVTLLAALVLGAFNGVLVSRINIMPIVATLASNAIFLGLVRMISGNRVSVTPPGIEAFASSKLLGLPATLWVAVAFIAVVAFVMNRTRLGREYRFVGAAPRMALAAGINVNAYIIGTYAFASACFAVTGILLSGVIGSASHIAGPEYLLPGIAAVVVGGTAFGGGTGSVLASAVAALFMVQLGQLVLAMGAGTAGQLLVQAVAVVVATALRNFDDILRLLKRNPRLAAGASVAASKQDLEKGTTQS
ncbi:ABC transporter permease [Maritimibacter sp. DP07]|uniref:ABC transporter permease n=2 Tax=Maritimibacter harenae TaxID=2606218 RepID=A0A845MA00_9RHOB|nr:ABC transporter permease [Maritimibacter harenae]